MRKKILILVGIIQIVFFFELSVYAQSLTDSLNEKRYGFLPIVSFNSDKGFIGGIDVQEFDYRGDELPYRSYSNYNFQYNSNIGSYNLRYYIDKVRTFNTDVRSAFDIGTNVGYGNYFPGITVSEGFDRTRFDSSLYYQFNAYSFSTSISTRWPYFLGEFIKRSDTKIALQFFYHNPFDLEPISYLNEKRPKGYNYTAATLLELGLVIERRNSEFQAQIGYSYGFNIKGSIPLISTLSFGSTYIGGAYYYPIIANKAVSLTWATRASFSYVFGDAPFWYLPNLGGSNLRGYMWLREIGYGMVNYSTELRSWFISIPYKDIRLGLNVFADGGSVYDRKIKFSEPHLFTVGFGGVMSIFTPDYIMKFDIGFSKEGMGIYLGTGYSF